MWEMTLTDQAAAQFVIPEQLLASDVCHVIQ